MYVGAGAGMVTLGGMVAAGGMVALGTKVGFGFVAGGLNVPGFTIGAGLTADGVAGKLLGRIGTPFGIAFGGGANVVGGGAKPAGLGAEKSAPGNVPGRFPSPGAVGGPCIPKGISWNRDSRSSPVLEV